MKGLGFLLLGLLTINAHAAGGEAHARLLKMEAHLLGTSFQGDALMQITHRGTAREIAFRIWSSGDRKSSIKILRPVKDRGVGNLRLGNELWQYLPRVERTIKVPASLMLQSWMGSDFTNDDLVKASRLSRDYESRVEGEESLDGAPAVKITCAPRKGAPIVWRQVIVWVRKTDSVLMKQEFFTEDDVAARVMVGSKFQTHSGHTIPTRFESWHPASPAERTVLTYERVRFDEKIPESVFTQLFLGKPPES